MENDKVERLIEIVRQHVFLYDWGHPQYKNAAQKSTVWETIGEQLDESGETVRSKWKTIRDGYTKYKKQIKSSRGSNKKNVSYTWASQLSFLDKINGTRGASNEDSQYSKYEDSQADNLEVLVSPLLSVSTQDPPSPTTRSSRKRSIDNGDDRRYKKKNYHDSIDNLFLSYADTFKRFPLREQAIVKLELAKLFSNTELQLLDNNAYDTNKSFKYASSRSVSPSSDGNAGV